MPTATELTAYRMFIDGQWVEAESTFESLNPFTGGAWAELPLSTGVDVDRAVAAARRAFDEGPWPLMTGRDRAHLMRRLADLIRRDADRLATVETSDNGKLLREMSAQVAALPEHLDYFAGWADKVEGAVLPTEKPNYLVYTRREPVGVVAAITAWNSPLLLLMYKLAPALAAGCTVICKPAEQASASTLEFAALVEEVGIPPGVFNVVCGGRDVGAALTGHRGVDKVAFTGSTQAGVAVAQNAATHLAPTTLELGGKSAQIIYEDCDVAGAINGIVAGVFAATGQTCLAGSRALVHRSILDEVTTRLVERAKSIRLGDPLLPDTEMGPVAFRAQHEKILRMLEASREEGAEVLTGGGPPNDPELANGLFIAPTVVAGAPPTSTIAQEEVFGPVVCLFPFEDEDEAVRLANDVAYGLAAGIWTRDLQRAHRTAHLLRCGTVWINSYRVVSYAVPFGGVKLSGYGRECGQDGLYEFLALKSIWVELSGETRDPFALG